MALTTTTKHFKKDYTTQGNLQIQLNLCEITNGIFHRSRTNIFFLICMETQKTPNTQSNPKNEKCSWDIQAPRFQSMLQSYSHQNSTVLAQKQKSATVEQNRDHRDKPTHLWSPNI